MCGAKWSIKPIFSLSSGRGEGRERKEDKVVSKEERDKKRDKKEEVLE